MVAGCLKQTKHCGQGQIEKKHKELQLFCVYFQHVVHVFNIGTVYMENCVFFSHHFQLLQY